jgi:hypothetical protein
MTLDGLTAYVPSLASLHTAVLRDRRLNPTAPLSLLLRDRNPQQLRRGAGDDALARRRVLGCDVLVDEHRKAFDKGAAARAVAARHRQAARETWAAKVGGNTVGDEGDAVLVAPARLMPAFAEVLDGADVVHERGHGLVGTRHRVVERLVLRVEDLGVRV